MSNGVRGRNCGRARSARSGRALGADLARRKGELESARQRDGCGWARASTRPTTGCTWDAGGSGHGNKNSQLDWNVERSRTRTRSHSGNRRSSLKGERRQPAPAWYWTMLRSPAVTVDPLGGCWMGQTASTGVGVDHRGDVFGYPDLFVADGSVLPVPVGRNPSMTIAAIAERSARLMATDGRR